MSNSTLHILSLLIVLSIIPSSCYLNPQRESDTSEEGLKGMVKFVKSYKTNIEDDLTNDEDKIYEIEEYNKDGYLIKSFYICGDYDEYEYDWHGYPKEKKFGDQKYLDEWDKYEIVNVISNYGGGIAPWNLNRYKMKNDNIIEKETNSQIKPVFFHYHYLQFIDETVVNINVYKRYWSNDKRVIEYFYIPYLTELKKVRSFLREKFNWTVMLKNHPALKKEKKKITFNPLKIINYIKRKIIETKNKKKDILYLDKFK